MAPADPTPDPALDRRFMALALALAGRGLGSVWPNPAVGCVLVREGRIVGRGWTQPGGRPHAESEALARAARAGAGVQGATCYVTLEPCAHEGKTGPCADALVRAGIARAVVALEDPDPRVAGRGLATLEAAGIAVARGCMEDQARALNAGFLSRIERGRPHVTLKLASSLDGRIATRSGDSRWITGPRARARAHLLRARHDAVMVGAASALADDPQLSCRLSGMEGSNPVRVVIDGSAPLPGTHALIAGAGEHPTWIVSTPALGQDGRHAVWEQAGAEVIAAAADEEGRPLLAAALEALAGRGLTRVLVEGGGRLAAALLQARLVDRIEWFRAPGAIGGDGVPALAALGIERARDMARFVRLSSTGVGEDVLDTLVPAA